MAKIEIETRYTVDLTKFAPEDPPGIVSTTKEKFRYKRDSRTFTFNDCFYPEIVRDVVLWCIDNLRHSQIKNMEDRVILTTTDESDITAFKLRWC